MFWLQIRNFSSHPTVTIQSSTWMAIKAAMHIQFPIKHKTPRCHWSSPISMKLDKSHPTGSGWPLTRTSFSPTKSSLPYPNKAGPRNKTINMAPETQMKVPPTFAWPSVVSKFTLSVLHEQVHTWNWTSNIPHKTLINIDRYKRYKGPNRNLSLTPSLQPREMWILELKVVWQQHK